MLCTHTALDHARRYMAGPWTMDAVNSQCITDHTRHFG